ncbi:MAG: zinc-ribbon domain-containing protein [Chloroflexota bacterium]
MDTCPVCHNKVSETAKFCPECGTRLTGGTANSAWIAAMQERIRHTKENDLYYIIFAAVGAVTAIVIPYVTRFVLRFRMDGISWLLTLVGILFFIGGFLGTWYSDRKVKELIEDLEKGPGQEHLP